MNIQILLTIIGGVVVGVAAVISAIFYIFSRIRKDDMETLRNSNTDLRAAIDDKGKEIRDMLVIQGTQKAEIDNLKDRVKSLETSNKTLEDIFKAALNDYFEKHPEIAVNFKK